MSRRDQLRSLSAQIRQPPEEPPVKEPAAGANSDTGGGELSEAPPADSTATKTSLNLPTAAAQRLRDWSQATGRSLADGIVTALIDTGEDLEQRSHTDARRVRLGLPAIAAADSGGGERTTVTIRIPRAALDELDAAAQRLGLTRSALAAALLEQCPL